MHRGGVALPAVLVVLVLVGAMLAAGFAATVADYRASHAMVEAVRAAARADRHAVLAATMWPAPVLRDLAVGASLTGPAGASAVTRWGPDFFLFEGVGRGDHGVARRRVGLIATSKPAHVAADRALSSSGAVRAAVGSRVLDSPPGRFPICDAADSSAIGWVERSGGAGARDGLAAWVARATVTLPSGATVTPRPSISRGACDVADAVNWGDPGGGVCATRWPVVHVSGPLRVAGGRGQGVLVVEGDLELTGGVRFDGLILVGGKLSISGLGAVVRGAVRVEDRVGVGSDLGAMARLTYSTCTLDEVARRHGPIQPIERGGWFGEY